MSVRRPDGGDRGPRRYLPLIIGGIALLYLIVFVVENRKTVSVHWVVGTTRSSLIWVILVSLALGLLIGVGLSRLRRRR
jgi:uncharacterized integral membrane protein